jgi:A/G-specific adenine glycosylase
LTRARHLPNPAPRDPRRCPIPGVDFRTLSPVDPARALLAWYDRGHRDLPWRRPERQRDPWSIWVSEVMLQQTRVETVLGYYERFLARFPDPGSLAAAPTEEVLRLWSGLGYYRRARQLQLAARALVAAEATGEPPRTAAALAGLPGVGAYTAAAIASIAFDEPVPVLDGNVARVLARRLALAEPPTRAAARRRLLAAAAELLDPERPGDSNQALMELGATICTPRAPGCVDCPLAAGCEAHAAGELESYPVLRPRPASRRVRQCAAVVRGAAGVLLVRRGEAEPLLSGLWELPTVEARGPRAAEVALGERFGGHWRLDAVVARLRHTVTFRALEIEARRAEWRPGAVAEAGAAAGWFPPADAAALALTGVTRKLLARIEPSA